MAEAEIDINTLQYVMGHENPKMILKVYDHVNLERVQKQMKKLDSSKDIAWKVYDKIYDRIYDNWRAIYDKF